MKNDDLNLQIETTTTRLTELENELGGIPAKMSDAVDRADAETMIALRLRENNLPVELQMMRLRLEQLKVRRKEESLPQMDAEVETLFKPIPALEAAYNEAKSALEAARFTYTDAIENRRYVRQEIADERRMIEHLKRQKV
jgi:chromosome segregation ATPase